jgi:hypothetical protein
VIVQFFYAANGRLSVKASLPDIGSESSVSIERSSGISEKDLARWEQRIAQGDYFPQAPAAKKTEPPAARPVSPGREAPAARPASQQALAYDPPHTFDDEEDSEVFSDLDF